MKSKETIEIKYLSNYIGKHYVSVAEYNKIFDQNILLGNKITRLTVKETQHQVKNDELQKDNEKLLSNLNWYQDRYKPNEKIENLQEEIVMLKKGMDDVKEFIQTKPFTNSATWKKNLLLKLERITKR